MIAITTFTAEWFEAAMLVCFGASWPISVYKTYQSKQVGGKSLFFLILIFMGYLAGVTAKFIRASAQDSRPEWVTALYVLNAALVMTDIALYLRYRTPAEPLPG
jgi:uncharacterized membrane protein